MIVFIDRIFLTEKTRALMNERVDVTVVLLSLYPHSLLKLRASLYFCPHCIRIVVNFVHNKMSLHEMNDGILLQSLFCSRRPTQSIELIRENNTTSCQRCLASIEIQRRAIITLSTR